MAILINGTKVFENEDVAVYEFDVPGGDSRGTVALAKFDRARRLTAPDPGFDELAARIARKAHQGAAESGSWPTQVQWAS
jgi:hypothetical protein